ncbi:MAG: protein kinase [Acidobacteriia bacterium]|nr:protein kinase [Terriglobia bacterium]
MQLATPIVPQEDGPSGTVFYKDAPTSVAANGIGTAKEATPNPSPATPAEDQLRFVAGTIIAARYRIIELLGKGGMGEVYRAEDLKLSQTVALKFLPEALEANQDMLARFLREVRTARQVSHPNVCRVFDIGEVEGHHFLSMECIEGEDLSTLMKRAGRLPLDQVLAITRQLCAGIAAAHETGILHRDLKPQNIMVDKQGKVLIMDFGIARSMDMPGLTQTAALIGTPEYMSPEQARGEDLDARSDLFSLGIIFYELLTGRSPYKAKTTLASLWKRLEEPARPPIEADPTLPKQLNDIVMKCLQIDPQLRYARAAEILKDLESGQSPSMAASRAATGAGAAPVVSKGIRGRYWKWAAAGVAVLLLAGGFLFRGRIFRPAPPPHGPVSVLIADFDNTTADPIFDETLEPMLSVALEGASFITSYNRTQARNTAKMMQPGATRLDEALARLVAVREGVAVVVSGSISKYGNGYKVDVTTEDAATGKLMVHDAATVEGKKDVLGVAGKLAGRIRRALGDVTPESAQMAAAETFTTGSIDAAHEYALAQDSQYTGKYDDAIQHYLKAVQLDPNLGRAYSGLAVVYANLGELQDSRKYYQMALSNIDRMSDREKYRTRGGYYLVDRNPDKAIDELTQLVAKYPADTSGIANLALAYFYRRNMAKALEEGQRAVDLNPRNVPQLNNVGLYAMYAGYFDTAIRDQKAVLQLNPSFDLAFVGLALSQLAQGRPGDATATYQRLEKLGPRGESSASMGLADLALYEGRTTDALTILEKNIPLDVRNTNSEAAAIKSVTMAQAQLSLGHSAQARAAVEKAVDLFKETGVLYWASQVYLGLNEDSKALALAQQLSNRIEPDPQAYARLIQGEVELKRNRVNEAIRLFQESQKISDPWLGHLDVAKAYLQAGAFLEAHSELELCQKRLGEATAAFLDEVPTCRLIPPLYYYLGRAHEGLKSPDAANSYKTFLGIRSKGTEDPLLADARRRLYGR